jgi:Ca2+-transporting ATPase
MVTGDNLQTARAIALECGILNDPNVLEPVIIEGKTFRALSDLEREEAAENICVRVFSWT